jgi:hypothetical protein
MGVLSVQGVQPGSYPLTTVQLRNRQGPVHLARVGFRKWELNGCTDFREIEGSRPNGTRTRSPESVKLRNRRVSGSYAIS